MADLSNSVPAPTDSAVKFCEVESNILLPVAQQIATFLNIEHASRIVDIFDVSKKFKNLGEYCLPVAALKKFSVSVTAPETFASELQRAVNPTDFVEQINSQGGYLYLKLNRSHFFQKILRLVHATKETYGNTKQGENKTIIVEFSSPNIAKPFHAGHLRSTIIGNFLYHIHKALGYNVVALNYLGDWGKQYGLLALGYQKYGNEEELNKNPIKHLYEIYVKINKDKEENKDVDQEARNYFKKMEEGDEEALSLWKKFRELSISEYEQMYKRLNVHFDNYEGESLASKAVNAEVTLLKEKNLLVPNDGAQIIDLSKEGLPSPILIKKDGTTLYLTRDIATAHMRWEKYHFEKMYYVVACQQDLHFQQLFKTLELCGYEWSSRCKHINFGIVQGMSTRKGTVVFLQDILDEAKATMLEVMQRNETKYADIEDPQATADQIGMSAVFVQDFNAKRIKNYEMNWSRMTSFEGNTGPYLQYAHARLCSVQRKVLGEYLSAAPSADIDYSLLKEDEAFDLLFEVAKYPSILQRAFSQLEPVVLVSYLYELAGAISVAHEKLRVLGNAKEVMDARMLLFWAARMTLGNALRILGLVPLEKM